MGVNTIRRAEVAENGTSLTAVNELAIRRALEVAGVEFIDENGGGPGLRLREAPAAEKITSIERRPVRFSTLHDRRMHDNKRTCDL